MEFEYSSFRNVQGTFFRPTINVAFQYKETRFPYEEAIVDTGSDYVLLPMSIAEKIGAEPDFDFATEFNCACGGVFKGYASRHPIEIIVEHEGFRPRKWATPVQIIDANIAPLLRHRGFLDRFDAKFFGKRHIMELHEC